MYDGLKLGNEVKAEMHEVRRDKTNASQSAGLFGTMEVECVPKFDDFKLGNEVKAEAHDVVLSAVSESNGLKLGNEAEAEMYEVRRDKTKASQSAGLSGTMEIEHQRDRGIIAGATAGKPQEHQAVQSAVP